MLIVVKKYSTSWIKVENLNFIFSFLYLSFSGISNEIFMLDVHVDVKN